jgi:hypothetical protein
VEAEGNHSGNISIGLVNNATFFAGNGSWASAQLGHGGIITNGDFTGNITLNVAENLLLNAANGVYSYSMIGHGGFNALFMDIPTLGTRQGDITVTVLGNTSLVDNSDTTNGRLWQFGHWTSTPGGISNANVTLRTGTLGYDLPPHPDGLLNQTFADRLIPALSGGNLTVDIRGLGGIDGILRSTGLWNYTSPNTLTLISSRDVFFDAGGIANSDVGALRIVADDFNWNYPNLNLAALFQVAPGVNFSSNGSVRLFAVDPATTLLGGFSPANIAHVIWWNNFGTEVEGINYKTPLFAPPPPPPPPTDPSHIFDLIPQSMLALFYGTSIYPWDIEWLLWKMDISTYKPVHAGFPVGAFFRHGDYGKIYFVPGGPLPPKLLFALSSRDLFKNIDNANN